MNQAQTNARVGIFFVLGIALLWITFQALHTGSFNVKDGYEVTAPFKSVRELKVGNEVRMAGVTIGAVTAVRINNGRAEAVLSIKKEVPIHKDCVATIATSGLIGSNYISLDLGTPASGTVAPGDSLRTHEVPDFNKIMSDLGELGADIKVAVGKIGAAFSDNPDGSPGLITNVNNLVNENRANLNASIANLNEITEKIRAGDGTLAKLINDPAAYDQLLAAVTEIKNAATEAKGFIGETQTIIADVKSGRGAIGTLIYDEATAQNLKVAVKNISDITNKMNSDESSFGQLITNDNLVRDAKATLRKVDRAMDGFADSGPITAVGVVANGLF
ncbi:phospholipid/cholesterol/gamma-HCH transport system substrate-binding protein [Ereboglobus sp. PH5-5]|uniref:MlaD family protein n=1 Tax=Ereboglobus sp. PH5-5 TaxID=2940529 RepID=UPI0024060A05|nr:MlaD family protein [Ereboglobus sp. PH5-5]MDF9834098.1 phospholipid/cholesterol/gamma-HCH transport system substrate-binding protein [Ereboglobus sp. PH5-5]